MSADGADTNANGNAEAGPSGTNSLTPPAEEEEEEDARPAKRARAASIDSDDLDADGPSAGPSKEPSPPKRGPQVRPQPLKGIGEFMNCGECGRKFTVVSRAATSLGALS